MNVTEWENHDVAFVALALGGAVWVIGSILRDAQIEKRLRKLEGLFTEVMKAMTAFGARSDEEDKDNRGA